MTDQARRLRVGGRIDRTKPLKMRFDRRTLHAWQGDTLASAMLANGETVVGRSFKYHRPRGIFGIGVEEPNALVCLRSGARSEPNSRATVVEAYEGLEAVGQNGFPSVRFDLGAVNQLLSPFLLAGFYYKTFIGPFRGTRFWMFFEHFIRNAAGMGRAVKLADPDTYEKVNAHCDVLVVGGGPAGLAATLAAVRTGANVMLVEQDFVLGGSLLLNPAGGPADDWVDAVKDELDRNGNVTVLTRTTAFGVYEQNVLGLVERVWDHVAVPPEAQPRQRYWLVRAKQVIIATGTIEQPLVFAGNDRPGVMLASAVRGYLNRYAVLAGKSVVVATNNDSAWATACDLASAGARVTLVDARSRVAEDLIVPAKARSIEIILDARVIHASGSSKVRSVEIASLDKVGQIRPGGKRTLQCDLLAVSSGWSSVLHLWSQRFGKPVFDPVTQSFVPGTSNGAMVRCVGSVMGCGSLDTVISQGFKEGVAAARAGGKSAPAGQPPHIGFAPFADNWSRNPHAVQSSGMKKMPGKAFVDLQHDVTVDDIDLAYREGYDSIEHLKRYTTTGMATDQGKTSNLNALARMADLKNTEIPEVGTTTFRPPFTPISIGALVGRECDLHLRPIRRSVLHQHHLAAGARMTEAGLWMRPWFYPEHAEELRQACARESQHVRNHVGIIDVSTLGKIAIQGPDSTEFLNRIYVNNWTKLAIGRLRYGVMLREDGFVMDDGTTARIGEHEYFMTTTTANAASVLAFMEHLLQCAWGDMRVHLTSVTDQWATIAVAGPNARQLLQSVVSVDLSSQALPSTHFVYAQLSGTKIRIHRMSYSGELAYEVYIPSCYAPAAWEILLEAGRPLDLKPYGTEAMGALRIEKGHVAGSEIDGRTTLKDLALEGFASARKPFVGSVLRNRSLLDDPARPSIVGLEIEGDVGTSAGALLYPVQGPTKGRDDGHVTSTTWSPALRKHVALALLSRGNERLGESVRCVDFVGKMTLSATVVSHHFFDPEGVRQNA